MIIEEVNLKFDNLVPLTNPKYIIVHHSGVQVRQATETIHDYHKRLGWGGIGYHFYIRRNGVVNPCRPLSVRGIHTRGNNHHSIGACLEGNFEVEEPTNEQIQALKDVIELVKNMLGDLEVKKHKDFNSTACPGNIDLNQLDDSWSEQKVLDEAVNVLADKGLLNNPELWSNPKEKIEAWLFFEIFRRFSDEIRRK